MSVHRSASGNGSCSRSVSGRSALIGVALAGAAGRAWAASARTWAAALTLAAVFGVLGGVP
jgi:hypothetical protein